MKCVVPICNHVSGTAKYSCKFFQFPKDEKKLKSWRKKSRMPKDCKDPRICSCHFPDADSKNEPIIYNPDKAFALIPNSEGENARHLRKKRAEIKKLEEAKKSDEPTPEEKFTIIKTEKNCKLQEKDSKSDKENNNSIMIVVENEQKGGGKKTDNTTRPSTSMTLTQKETKEVKNDENAENVLKLKKPPLNTVLSMNSKSATRKSLNYSAVNVLKKWLYDHRYYAYPTENEKVELCKTTGLTLTQVLNWFINARRRLLPEYLKQEGVILGKDKTAHIIKRKKTLSDMNDNGEQKEPVPPKKIKIPPNLPMVSPDIPEKSADESLSTQSPAKIILNNITSPIRFGKIIASVPITNNGDSTETAKARQVIGHKIVQLPGGKVIKLEIFNRPESETKLLPKAISDISSLNMETASASFNLYKNPITPTAEPPLEIFANEGSEEPSKDIEKNPLSLNTSEVPKIKTENLKSYIIIKNGSNANNTNRSLQEKRKIVIPAGGMTQGKIKHIIKLPTVKNINLKPSEQQKILNVTKKIISLPDAKTVRIVKGSSNKKYIIVNNCKPQALPSVAPVASGVEINRQQKITQILVDALPKVEGGKKTKPQTNILEGIFRKEKRSKCLYMLVDEDVKATECSVEESKIVVEAKS